PATGAKPAHGPGVNPAKKAPSHSEDISSHVKTSRDFLSGLKKTDGSPAVLEFDKFKPDPSDTTHTPEDQFFWHKMGEQLDSLYKGGKLTAEARNSVKDVPEPILEKTVDVEGMEPKKFNGPLSDDGYAKYSYGTFGYPIVKYFKEVWPGVGPFVPGQVLLRKTEEALNPDGDIKLYQIIQAASQTNGLESINESHSPLNIQKVDHSQGPTVCSQSLTSWIKREAMYEDGNLPDSAADLLEYLVKEGVIEESSDYGEPYYKVTDSYTIDSDDLFYMNGYLRPSVLNDTGKAILAMAISKNLAGYMSQRSLSDEDVGNNHGNKQKTAFTMSFSAAMSYQGQTRPQDNVSYAMNYMWVYPQFENVVKDGIRASANLSDDHLVVVHLTGLGQFNFRNPPGIHQVALNNIVKKYESKLKQKNILIIAHWERISDDNVSSYTTQIKDGIGKIEQSYNGHKQLGFGHGQSVDVGKFFA
ncbi:MAG: hypothetical protein Q4D57_05395, partial [Clostridia bacterium]|nr:hypothetical protein [Clostridia bacterium]